MAARKNKIHHDDQTRAKIQAALLIRRMSDCVDGKIVLDPQQVSCAKALLNKVLPDLQSTTLQGNPINPVEMITTIRLCGPDG